MMEGAPRSTLWSRLYPPAEADEAHRTRYIQWFLTTFSLVLFFITIASFLIAGSSFRRPFAVPNMFTFLGLCILVGSVGFAGGGFLGFLFGVPRIRTDADPKSGVDSNTNLEQLSDSLTKFVVGVSLVEFGKINDALVAFAAEIDRALAVSATASAALGKSAGANGAVGKAVAASAVVGGAGFAADLVLIGSAIAGFLAAYLRSKTDLMRAFAPRQELHNKLGEVIADQIVGTAGRAALMRPGTVPDACARDAAAKLIQYVHPESKDPELHRLLGLGQAILGNWKSAADALQTAVSLSTAGDGASPELLTLASHALAKAGSPESAAAMTAKIANMPVQSDAAENDLSRMFTALYRRGGFDEAISLGEQLKTTSLSTSSGRLWLYLACAYGQKHSTILSAPSLDEEAVTQVRAAAISAVRSALQVDRANNLPALRLQLAAPGTTSPDENDLASLASDQELTALLA